MTSYTVVLSPNPAGAWVAHCPAMSGASAEGASRAAALQEIALVMAAWMEVAAGEPLLVADERPTVIAAALADILSDRAAEGWPLTVETVVVAPSAPVAA
ncbi:MAG: type II toxin-antitoxin system HicB family antitoxin [Dehalococcoidia bacterium]